MDLDVLVHHGATVTCGQVDRNGVHLGTLQIDGSVQFTQAGHDFVAELVAAAKPAKTPKAAKTPAEPAAE